MPLHDLLLKSNPVGSGPIGIATPRVNSTGVRRSFAFDTQATEGGPSAPATDCRHFDLDPNVFAIDVHQYILRTAHRDLRKAWLSRRKAQVNGGLNCFWFAA